MPAGRKLRVVEDDVDDSSAVDGRVRVHRASDLLDARLDSLGLVSIGSEEGDAAGTLTVQTEVLSKRLEQDNLVHLIGKGPQRVSISIEVTARKALICVIETDEMVFANSEFSQGVPLFLGRVAASRIVSAHVHDEDRALGRLVHVFAHALEVEAVCFPVVVPVLFDLVAGSVGDTDMGRPGRIRHVDLGVLVRVPLLQELEADT